MSETKKTNPALTLLPLTCAAVSTATIMYPVDVCRSLKMSSAGSGEPFSIAAYYRKFGVKGFVSKGVLPEIAKSSVMRVSKFFFFPIVGKQMWGKTPKEMTVVEKGIAGAFATFPEILLISPLEVAKLGMQLDIENKYKNNSTAFIRDMVKQRGVGSLWTGWAGMQWRQSSWTGTYFATLTFWKDMIEPPLNNVGAPEFVSRLISGFIAGFVATFPNAPGDVVRSVVQRRVFEDPSRKAYGISPRGVLEHLQVGGEIISSRGIGGLYSGIGFKAIHLGGSGALMAMLIPFFSSALGIPYGGV